MDPYTSFDTGHCKALFIRKIVIRWVNFRENHLHKHELQLSDYNILKYFDPNICIAGFIYIF